MKTDTQRIAICILAADYGAIRRLVPGDERLPAKYEDWERRASDHIAHLIKRAEKFITVVVKPHDLISYCRATGQQPSYTRLEAEAPKKANDKLPAKV